VVSTLWTEVRIEFDDLRQEGWGRPAKWDAHQVLEIHINVFHRDVSPGKPSTLSADAWIDDAELF
jgi:hypothetical protein